jgi:hypothetical protein
VIGLGEGLGAVAALQDGLVVLGHSVACSEATSVNTAAFVCARDRCSSVQVGLVKATCLYTWSPLPVCCLPTILLFDCVIGVPNVLLSGTSMWKPCLCY